ncbi:MAG: cysteine desulfurase family protein [Sneathiella sp.]
MTLISDHTETVSFKGEEIRLPLFLDHQSTTPLAPDVKAAMLDAMEFPGNAQSKSHVFGLHAADIVQRARQQVADLIGAEIDEIHFTSGATAANHHVLCQAACASEKPAHFISITSEHNSILSTFDALKQEGHTITLLPIKPDGKLSLEALEEALTPETALVSIQAANNETGVLQDLKRIGEICDSRAVPLHTDAVQALPTEKVDVTENKISSMSLSAHKMYGPQGIGALYVQRELNTTLRPAIEGTPPTSLIAGFGIACDLAHKCRTKDHAHLFALSNRLISLLKQDLAGDITLNGDQSSRLPGCLNVSFSRVSAEDLLLELPMLALSTGAACLSSSGAPSHVLAAMGITAAQSNSTIRIGLGRYVTEIEIEYAANMLIDAYRRTEK